MPKTKKAGLLTKLVILALLIYLATSLLNLQSRIRQTQAEREEKIDELVDMLGKILK